MSFANKSNLMVIINAHDMHDHIKKECLTQIRATVEKIENDDQMISKTKLSASKRYNNMARSLKKRLDEMYGKQWHVVVGNQFGSFVTHEEKHFLYCDIGTKKFDPKSPTDDWFETEYSILIFKTP